jgi:hypothetical protein
MSSQKLWQGVDRETKGSVHKIFLRNGNNSIIKEVKTDGNSMSINPCI